MAASSHPDLPPRALRVVREAAQASPDGRTLALVFGTHDFLPLLLNWCAFAVRARVSWFVIVALDGPLHAALSVSLASSNHLLLPRVASRAVAITKLNVIGERQRFGVRVLEAGLSVIHSDADALWMRDPYELMRGADIVGERIWGKPLSVVKAWGAGICTGFYFLRAVPAVLEIAREVELSIKKKHTSTPSFPRACPVISGEAVARIVRGEILTRGKARLWQALLQRSSVLHCFPPGGDPKPGEHRKVFMGHPEHTAAELAFQQRQGLWLLRSDWRSVDIQQQAVQHQEQNKKGFIKWIALLSNRSVQFKPLNWRAFRNVAKD